LVERLLPNTLGQLLVETPEMGMEALAQVEADYDNVRALFSWWRESVCPRSAIRVAIRLPGVWEVRGLYTECRQVLVTFLELSDQTALGHRGTPRDADDLTNVERASALAVVGISALRQGDYQEARARLIEAAALLRTPQLGNGRSLARRIYARAAEYFQHSVDRAQLSGGYTVARGLSHLGRALFLKGDLLQARRSFHDALQIMQTERIAGHSYGDCLDWVAALVDANAQPRVAAVLFGAADAQWQASGAKRYAPDRAPYTADLASVQSKMIGNEFAMAWAEGHALSRDEAVAYALESIQDETHG
jgi:hypothetical protein